MFEEYSPGLSPAHVVRDVMMKGQDVVVLDLLAIQIDFKENLGASQVSRQEREEWRAENKKNVKKGELRPCLTEPTNWVVRLRLILCQLLLL